jgi:hypothetical protein
MAGRYELVRELDARGEVRRWEAFDTALQRRVLLEFLPHDLVDDAIVVERFWRAARSSARTSTQVGERVMDAGTDRETGRAFVVREWLVPSDDKTVALPALQPQRTVGASRGSRLGSTRMVLLGLGLTGAVALVVARPGVEGWLAWVNEPFGQATQRFVLGPPPQVTVVPTQAPTAVTGATSAKSTPAATATARPAQTPTAVSGVARRIVNTDGRGVALRASPGGDRLPGKGYDEGATVQAFESSGQWTRIQGSDGRQGWVLSVTLSR